MTTLAFKKSGHTLTFPLVDNKGIHLYVAKSQKR